MAIEPPKGPTAVLRAAVELDRARANYRQGCDADGYRQDAAEIKALLDRVEAIGADLAAPVDQRILAYTTLSGLAGMVARNENSASFGRKSYNAMWTAVALADEHDRGSERAVVAALVALGFSRQGFFRRQGIQIGLGIDIQDELRRAANQLSRFPSDKRAQVALSMVAERLGNGSVDRAVRRATEERLRTWTNHGAGEELATIRAELDAELEPETCDH